jgi:hypothetical protein
MDIDMDMDIETWLTSLSAAEFAQNFVKSGFPTLGAAAAAGLADGDLRKMGLTKLRSRKTVYNALLQAARGTGGGGFPPDSSPDSSVNLAPGGPREAAAPAAVEPDPFMGGVGDLGFFGGAADAGQSNDSAFGGGLWQGG